MPFIQINTSSKSDLENVDLLQKDISKMVADLTGKPEDYVMTMIQIDNKMTFAGSDEPCCFINVKSIDLTNNIAGNCAGQITGVNCKNQSYSNIMTMKSDKENHD